MIDTTKRMSQATTRYSLRMIKKTAVISMFLDDFCEKEVISIRDCRKLGNVHNLEFDECSGCICKIIVREHCGFWGFWNVGEEICIPFCKIKQIGPDIILVDV